MTDDLTEVGIEVGVGSLTPEEVQEILDQISGDLQDPDSKTAQMVGELGLTVGKLRVDQDAAFALETFLIYVGIKFAGGAAAAGGALFFNKVIKPRIIRKRADGVGEIQETPGAESDEKKR